MYYTIDSDKIDDVNDYEFINQEMHVFTNKVWEFRRDENARELSTPTATLSRQRLISIIRLICRYIYRYIEYFGNY